MATLDEIGLKHGTDKASVNPDGTPGHDYLKVYESLLPDRYKSDHLSLPGKAMVYPDCPCPSCKRHKFRLLEIGVEYGKSIKTWEEAYPHAVIVGVDKEPLWSPTMETRTSVGIHKVDVTKEPEEFLRILTDYGPFDLIVDDASHRGEETIAAFGLAWEFLKPGGWYAIEDTQTDYKGEGWPTEHGILREFLAEKIEAQYHQWRAWEDGCAWGVGIVPEEIRLIGNLWLFRKGGIRADNV